MVDRTVRWPKGFYRKATCYVILQSPVNGIGCLGQLRYCAATAATWVGVAMGHFDRTL